MAKFENVKRNIVDNLFRYTKGLQLETINKCNLELQHKRCPLNIMKKRTMSLELIEKILTELRELGYNKLIFPYGYGEPLIDPRFFVILDMIRRLVPRAGVYFHTNGYMMDKTMLFDLEKYGVKRINFSIYTPEEGIKWRKFIQQWRDKTKIELRAWKRWPFVENMNNKREWYEEENPINSTEICRSPLRYITINSSGNVVLCCHDWMMTETFGSLIDKSLFEIITSDKFIRRYSELTQGHRSQYFLCSRCNKSR